MLLIISCSAAWAADLEKGLVAYKAGDYATELAEWKPLAEQNNLQGQTLLGAMHAEGRGAIQDNVYAHTWLNIAVANGL